MTQKNYLCQIDTKINNLKILEMHCIYIDNKFYKINDSEVRKITIEYQEEKNYINLNKNASSKLRYVSQYGTSVIL